MTVPREPTTPDPFVPERAPSRHRTFDWLSVQLGFSIGLALGAIQLIVFALVAMR